jgi:hypothetical protein
MGDAEGGGERDKAKPFFEREGKTKPFLKERGRQSLL